MCKLTSILSYRQSCRSPASSSTYTTVSPHWLSLKSMPPNSPRTPTNSSLPPTSSAKMYLPSISIGSRPVCGDRGQTSSREHQSDYPKQPRQQNPRLLIRTPVLYLPNHSCADTVQKLAEGLISSNGYKRVVGLSSSYGKDIVPRLAGKYGVQPITEVIEIVVISP